jgi:hypothetical protein
MSDCSADDDGGRGSDALLKALHAQCPFFFRDSDLHSYRALDALARARETILLDNEVNKRRGGGVSGGVGGGGSHSVAAARLVGGASALVTLICVLFCVAPYVVRVLL